MLHKIIDYFKLRQELKVFNKLEKLSAYIPIGSTDLLLLLTYKEVLLYRRYLRRCGISDYNTAYTFKGHRIYCTDL